MNFFVLSRRHTSRGDWCDGCRRQVGRNRAVAKLVIRDGSNILAEVRICAPCAREAARAAEPVPR